MAIGVAKMASGVAKIDRSEQKKATSRDKDVPQLLFVHSLATHGHLNIDIIMHILREMWK